MSYLKTILEYVDLGYDITPTIFLGKEAIVMIKRYSYVADRSLSSLQIMDFSNLENDLRLNAAIQIMYDDIKEQEETGNYRESMVTYLKNN